MLDIRGRLSTRRNGVPLCLNELDFDLDLQSIDHKLDGLPGPCAALEGAFLAEGPDEPVGVVAVQLLDETGVCEMKRLYVRSTLRRDAPRHRGLHGPSTSRTARRSNHDPLDDAVFMERRL